MFYYNDVSKEWLTSQTFIPYSQQATRPMYF